MQRGRYSDTYAYISDAHDGHGTAGNIHFAYGPGEVGYESNCKTTPGIPKFFIRLRAMGMTIRNRCLCLP